MENGIQRPALTAKTMRKPFKACAGFTLIELMIVVAIIAIIGVFAVPGFVTFIQNNRIKTQSSEFVTSLALARMEAIKRARRVVVCPGTTASGCTGTDWEIGWIVFADTNDNSAYNPPGDVALEVHDALAGGNELRGTDGVAGMISFMPSGLVKNAANNDLGAGEGFTLCLPVGADNRWIRSRVISITTIGRTRIATSDAAGLPVGDCQ